MAPRGQFELAYPKRGEWACRMLPSDARGATGMDTGGFGDLVVFTAGNDVPLHYPLQFAGIMTNAADLGDENRDTAAAMDVGGTVTGVNYGPETLYSGDLCYIGLPLMFEDGPGRFIVAIPAGGMPVDKAHFGTYRLKWNNVCSASAEIRDVVEKAYKASPTQDFTDLTNIENVLDLSQGVRTEMPLFNYGCLYAHEMHLRYGKQNEAHGVDRVRSLNAMLRALKIHEQRHEVAVAAYDNSIGQSAFHVGHQSALQAMAPLAEDGSVLEPAGYKRMLDMYNENDRLKEMYLDRMHAFLRERMMGMVLSTSEPRQQLDLMLGQAR